MADSPWFMRHASEGRRLGFLLNLAMTWPKLVSEVGDQWLDSSRSEIMGGEIRDTDPLCSHGNIAVGCSECAEARRAAEAARKAQEEKK